MSDSSLDRTTSTLLAGLLEPANESVWRELDQRYRPVLHAVARRMGLPDADAEDAAQETLLQFVRDYRQGKYDRSKGRLRYWVQAILRNRVRDLHRRKSGWDAARGESVLLHLADEKELEEVWEAECRRQILAKALGLLVETTDVQPTTAEAFRLYALEDQPASEVAEKLGLSVRSVYLSKHRCSKALKDIVTRLTASYDDE